MLKVLALIGLAAVSFGSPLGDSNLSPVIIGGKKADIKDNPWQVALSAHGYPCGGSIINKNTVLTSGICTEYIPVDMLTVRSGSNYFDKEGTLHTVVEKIEHPNYHSPSHDYDFSLLKVDPPFEFGPGVAAIPLVEAGVKQTVGTSGRVTGWGEYSGGVLAPQLQGVEVPVVSQADCQATYDSEITDRMFCAGFPNGGKDACSGDIGGPFVVDDTLVGVISWGGGCGAKNTPGVYSNIADQRDWIDKNSA